MASPAFDARIAGLPVTTLPLDAETQESILADIERDRMLLEELELAALDSVTDVRRWWAAQEALRDEIRELEGLLR